MRDDDYGGANPARIFTRADLANALRLVHATAGQLPLREIEQLAQARSTPLSRSTAGRMLRGDKIPTAAALRAFLSVCGVPAADLPAWLLARNRLMVAARATRATAARVQSTHTTPAADPDWRRDADIFAHDLATVLLPLAEEMLKERSGRRDREGR